MFHISTVLLRNGIWNIETCPLFFFVFFVPSFVSFVVETHVFPSNCLTLH